MKKKFLAVLTLTLITLFSVAGLTACSGGEGGDSSHVHAFTKMDISKEYVKMEATCESPAVYYYSCACGKIGENTFEYGSALGHNYENSVCKNCQAVKHSEGLEYTLINNDTEYEVTGAGLCTDMIVSIPETHNGKRVTSIGANAFENRAPTISVVIPDSVTSIGDSAFYNCSLLTSVVIGDSVTSIGDRAFSGCTSLTSVEIPNSVTSIGGSAFSGCNKLNYNVKDGLKYLGNSANKYLYLAAVSTSITTANIDINCKFIGRSAFLNCSSLTSVEIPDSVTSIGDSAFYSCSSLTSVVIPDSVTSIGSYAFSWCDSLTSVVIPDSVTSIGDYAFSNCSSLTSVEIPNSVTSIGVYAFHDCTSLTSIEIPDSVTSIGYFAFYNCTSLTSVEIGDSVTSIGYCAFYNCYSLTSVVIGDSVTSIGDRAFEDCSSLTIYCEAESKPIGWSYSWNYSNCPVVWDYDGQGVIN